MKSDHIQRMIWEKEFEYHAFPGAYPLYYITANNGVLCPKCANKNFELCTKSDDPQWMIEAVEANWEDPDLVCDNCYEKIDAAYEDDKEKEID